MKIQNFYPVELCDGGGTYVSIEIDTNARDADQGYSCFGVTWSVENDFSGMLTFDTLGAAVAYVALIVEAVSMEQFPPVDARQIETEFARFSMQLKAGVN